MKRTGTIVALLAMFIVLFWSIGRLFALRFERGDVYPAYSTLRSDPMGAKAIADSLALMPGFEVRRNYRALVRLKPEQPVTLTYIGLDYHAIWEDQELEEFERLISTGSRAVFAFNREMYRGSRQILGAPTPAPGATPAPNSKPKLIPANPFFVDDESGTSFADVAKGWGFQFEVATGARRTSFDGVAVRTEYGHEDHLPWHSALGFAQLSGEWKTLYTCNDVPVMIERKFGEGSIVLCSDSFFLSNEGLSSDPPGELLAALFSSPHVIIFDEEHLGVGESANIAGLARRMRLHGIAIALVVVAGLFVWKQSSSLLPMKTSRSDDHDVTGSDANEGFITLLHRSVPPSSLVETCVGAWVSGRSKSIRADERAHIDAILRAHGERSLQNAPAAYRAIAEGLKRK